MEARRGDARLAAMPVIVVSSREDAATQSRLQQLGATDFVAKALMDPGRFLKLVATHL
jgi:PleD family two-component response regulator